MGVPCPKPSRSDSLRAEYAEKNKDARELGDLYRKVYRRDNYTCVACGRQVVVGSLDKFKRAHPHHIIPRSLADKAIKHTSQNICTVCPFCHADIGDQKLFIRGNADQTLRIVRVRE